MANEKFSDTSFKFELPKQYSFTSLVNIRLKIFENSDVGDTLKQSRLDSLCFYIFVSKANEVVAPPHLPKPLFSGIQFTSTL